MDPRDYQLRTAIEATLSEDPTLVVAPTGAGKTVIGALICKRLTGRTVWLTHTKELVAQSAAKLREWGLRVGVVAPGYGVDPFADVQVVSIQTAVSRELEMRCSNVFLDEAHHFAADDWRVAMERFGARRTLGATATPERPDGKPLGDLFSRLVVAASYSELIHRGFLVPARILRPSRELEKGVALKPLDAYVKHGEGRVGFGYARGVPEAEEISQAFRDGGVASSVVEANTPAVVRALELASLHNVRPMVLWNVYCLTEGVDVPPASIAIFGRNFGHVSTMLQASGRVLRASPGKVDALILDLPGMTHRLGLPIEDREYSLTGQGIRRTQSGMALTLCMKCGATFRSGSACPRCGHTNPTKPLAKLRIYNEDLKAVYSGGTTPDWAKKAELDRLRAVARDKGLAAEWVKQQYRELFGEDPQLGRVALDDEKKGEYLRLVDQALKNGRNLGWAAHRYKAAYGAFPPRRWTLEAERHP